MNFELSNKTYASSGKLVIRLPLPTNTFIEQLVDDMNPRLPLLFGLDKQDTEGIYVSNLRNWLVEYKEGWIPKLSRKFCHLILILLKAIPCTAAELTKIRRHFYHPRATKFDNLIKRATPM